MAMVALAFAVLDFGGATDLGIVLLAREIPIVIFLLLGGVFADRLPRRMILVGERPASRARRRSATAVLLFAGTANVWNVALLQAVFGVAAAFSRPATIGHRQGGGERRAPPGGERAARAVEQRALDRRARDRRAHRRAGSSGPGDRDRLRVTFFASAALTASMHLAPTVRMASASILGDLRDGWREFVERSWAVAMVASFGLFQLTLLPGAARARAARRQGGARWRRRLGDDPRGRVGRARSSAGSSPSASGRPAARRLPAVRRSRPGLLLRRSRSRSPLSLIAVIGFVTGIGFAFGDTLWDDGPPAQRSRARAVADQLVRLARLGRPQPDRLRPDRPDRRSRSGRRRRLPSPPCSTSSTCVGVILVPSVHSLRASAAPGTATTEPAA